MRCRHHFVQPLEHSNNMAGQPPSFNRACILLPPQVVDFKHGSVHRVLIVSYETLRKHSAELAGTVDLLVSGSLLVGRSVRV